ncbi:MAG: hypothetical protein IIA41_04465 [SAR324 cluster bacterium]|nr:hypothetical protein [SAR324 cluster bacterium]
MKSLRLSLLVTIIGLWAHSALAVEVEATGMAAILSGNIGSARTQAVLNAQRSAVEQGVGVILDSKTLMENFDLIQDQVLTSSKGFITNYLVLEEKKSADGRSFLVKIKANVSTDLLEDRLSALRILHRKMGNKRLMVIYHSENPNAMKRTHGATTAALQALRDEFNSAGFRLFNESATREVYRQIEVAGRVDRPVDDLIAMALDQQADILVRFENIGGKRGPQGGAFSAAFSTIRVSVFDTNTGRQIADAQTEGKQLLRADAGPYDWEKALAQASIKAARNVADEAISKIGNYYEQVEDQGNAMLLVFRGFDEDQKDAILDYLENTPGFRQLSELKNTLNYMEIEVFSNQQPSRLRRMVRSGLKDKGLAMQTQSASRNRIVFTNPRQSDN